MNKTLSVRGLSTILLLFGILLFNLSTVFAQGLTTAGINGMVTDKNGNALIGANVVAKHIPSGTIFGAVTRDDGKYNIANAKVGGPYQIKATFIGYKTEEVTNVVLELSQNLKLNFKLAEDAIQGEEVVVTADRDNVFNSNKTGASTNISARELQALPTVNRSILDMARLTPQIAGSGVDRQSGSSAAGKHNKYNNIQIDGAVSNDVFGLPASGTPGGQANAQPISMDAIQEFQVAIAPYDIRLGGFTGASINAITRSGSNALEGSVYTLFRNDAFTGKSTTNVKSGKFSEYLAGFRVGGPILKDQLFFFVNGENFSKSEPLTQSILVRPTQIDSFENRLKFYGYDPGARDFTDKTKNGKLFLRFDMNINDNNRLTLRHNFISASDDVLRRASGFFYLANSNYIFNSVQNSTVLQLNTTLGSSMSNEFRVSRTSVRDNREYPGDKFPVVQINTTQRLYGGSEGNSTQNALDQDIYEITNDFSYYWNDHVFTVGTHNEFMSFSNLFIQNYYGYYEFNTVQDFYDNKPSRYRLSYSNLADDPAPRAAFDASQFSFYVQDEWSVLPNLKVTGGVRVDIPYFPDKPLYNYKVDSTFAGKGYSTDKVPNGKYLFSPRVGFNYDVFEDKTTQIRGGTGIFSGRAPYVWLSNQYSNTGVDFSRIDERTAAKLAGKFSADPNNQPKTGLTVTKTTAINMTDPDFELPQVWRSNIAVDQKLDMGFVASMEFIYSMNKNDVAFYDINLGDPNGAVTFDGRPDYSGKRVNSANFTQVILMKSTNDGYQYTITPSLQKQFGQGILPEMSLLLAYNYTRAKDIHSATSTTAGSQLDFNRVSDPMNLELSTSGYEIPHRFIANVNYELEIIEGFKTTLGLFYEGRSGRSISYGFDGDLNGDGSTLNDILYVPTEDELLVKVPAGTATFNMNSGQAAALNEFIKKDGYLNDNRGKILPRNGGNLPATHKIDFKLIQRVPLPAVSVFDKHALEFSLDILNLGNLLNKEWGRTKVQASENPVKYNGKTAGKANLSFDSANLVEPFIYDETESRWYIQLGTRYTF